MIFMWSDDLLTGNSAIDNQHKQIIEAFRLLLNACNHRQGRDEVDNTLHYLTQYTVTHFDAEEKLQIECSYPDYDEHKAEHEYFTREIDKLNRKFNDEGATAELVAEVVTGLGEWLVSHIKKSDKDFAVYYRTH